LRKAATSQRAHVLKSSSSTTLARGRETIEPARKFSCRVGRFDLAFTRNDG
jgi:hypothetical protein